MLNKIKKYGLRFAGSVGAFALGFMAIAQNAKAAADESLTALTASSSAFMNDNLTLILSFIGVNFLKILGAGLGILALYWVGRKVRSLFNK